MRQALRHFARLALRREHRSAEQPQASALLGDLLRQVAKTQEEECSCDDAYELMDQFAEATARGEDTAQLMPLIHHHLEMCPECREEFEALLRSIGASPI